MCLFQFWFPQCVCPEVELLGSMAVLLPVFLFLFCIYSTNWGMACMHAQLCRTLCNPVDCSLKVSSVHGFLQARILEWVAISFSRGSSGSRDQTQVSCIADRFFSRQATSVKALVAQSCLTLCDLMDCSLPGSSVLEFLRARILEWVAISSSMESSWPRDGNCLSCISCLAGIFFTNTHYMGSQLRSHAI